MTTSHIKAIIFDYGNVLIEWDPRHVYNRYFPNNTEAMERFFKEVDFMGWNAHQDKGRSFKDGVADLSKQFPHYSHLIQAYHDHWKDSIGIAYTDTVEIMKQLKAKGYPLYGLSNWSAETFPYAREKYDFFDLFDDMVISGEVKLVKPDPAIFHLMLQRIKRPAAECLLIDDSADNIVTAQSLGLHAIRFESPEQLAVDLKRLRLL